MSGDQSRSSCEERVRLKSWTTWQRQWRKVQGTIAGKLEREPGDLVMNYAEGIRQVIEEKEALEYAKITTEFDKYRGKPDFYQLPEALPKRLECYVNEEPKYKCGRKAQGLKCCCNTTEPTYFLVQSKPQRFIVPEVHLVGIPDAVRQRKNILNGSRNIYKRWQQSKYRQEQMNKWFEKIKNIVPHWPEMEHLAIVGTKITQPKKPVHKEPKEENLINKKSKSNLAPSPSALFQKPRFSLTLNDDSLDDCEEVGTKKFRLFFDYDICSSEIMVNFLAFENTGLATIRVSWQKLEKFRLFRNYTNKPWEKHGFYFTRQELVVLPGSRISVPVWFKTENAGNYSESWELITNPRLWSEDFHVILILESYSYFKDLRESVDSIVKYIEEKTKHILVDDILKDLLESVKYAETPVVTCFYGIPQLFEMANLVNGRPLYLFNEMYVEELRHIYDGVKISGCSCEWDYSIKQIQNLARAKDLELYGEKKFTDIMDKILRIEEELRERASGRSPSKISNTKERGNDKKGKKDKKDNKGQSKSPNNEKENDKLKKGKSSSHIDVTESQEYKREPYIYSNQIEVWNAVRKFDSPVIINTEREKYAACFHILDAYFTKMCNQLEQLEIDKNIKVTTFYPAVKNKLLSINEQPERMVYEYFDYNYIPSVVYDDFFYPFEVKKKPKNLKNIPTDDVEAIHMVYFNKSAKESEKKDKKGKNDKSSKSPKDKKDKKSKNDNKSKEELVKKEESVESFNPYAEYFDYRAEYEDEVFLRSEGATPLREADEDYHYKQYLTVYSCLSSAVDAIFDTLESFECVVPYSAIEIVGPQFPNDGPEKVEENEAETEIEQVQ